MREISFEEIQQVDGAGIAGDIGRWIGEKIGHAQNTIKEYMYNEPFRLQYEEV